MASGEWLILRQYTEFYDDLLRRAHEKITADEIEAIKCTSCHNETFSVEEEKCLVCGHSEDVLTCRWCKEPYIYSACEYDEAANMCPDCEWKDGYAAANFEKY